MKRQILIEKYVEPSETQFINGSFVERWFDRNYDLHSFMGQPACIEYYNGKIEEQAWFKKGVWHRDRDLPAIIIYENEKEIRQDWYNNNCILKIEKL